MRISVGSIVRPRKTIIHGPRGVGKTTAGSDAPEPLFLCAEEGLNDIGAPRVEFDDDKRYVAQSLEEFNAGLDFVLNGEHDCRTLVVDTIDWLEKLIHDKVCRDNNVESIEKIGYGKGYKFAILLWRQFLATLDDIRAQRGMHIVLLAHSTIAKVEPPDTPSYTRYTLAVNPQADALLGDWADEIFFANYKVITTVVGESFGKKTHQGVGTGDRVMYTQDRPPHSAKNRLGMPLEVPFAWDEYAKYLPQAEQSSQQTEEPQQVEAATN